MMTAVSEVLAIFPFLGWFFAFVLGAIVGSFLNVCIYRIPVGKSIISPGSRCSACGAPIKWFDNIPIVSWFVLRGRARCCGAKFRPRYAAVEFLTAVLFLFAWLRYDPAVAVVGWVFIALLIVAVFVDLDHMIIPDRISIGGAFVGLGLAAVVPELHGYSALSAFGAWESFRTALIGFLVGSAVVFWVGAVAEALLKKEAMGLGDVKLAGLFGAFCGWQGAVFALFGGALLGTLVLLPFIIWQRFGVQPKPQVGEDESAELGIGSAVPFGPMLAAAALIYFLFLSSWVDTWLSEFAHTLEFLFTN